MTTTRGRSNHGFLHHILIRSMYMLFGSLIGGALGVLVTYFALDDRGHPLHKPISSVFLLPKMIEDLEHYFNGAPRRFMGQRPDDGRWHQSASEGQPSSPYFLIGQGRAEGFEVAILDAGGGVQHSWPLDWVGIMSDRYDAEFVKRAAWAFDAILLPNSDLLLNVSSGPVIRVDACGKVLWTALESTHHAMSDIVEGAVLVPDYLGIRDEGYFAPIPVKAPFREEGIAWISLDGDVLRRRSFAKVMVDSELSPILVQGSRQSGTGFEATHLNSVDVLTAGNAAAFPAFEEGDLLISDRRTSTIVVTDSGLSRVKWHVTGLTYRQHEARFTGEGLIAVFDNGFKDGGSQIVFIDPERNVVAKRWPLPGSPPGEPTVCCPEAPCCSSKPTVGGCSR